MKIAALPMYDWPERRAEVDAEWTVIRDRLRTAGVDAPENLSRDIDEGMPLWRHPDLLFAQTCWGPMERGLAEHVTVVGQPSYDGVEGGAGELYSSAIVMRAEAVDAMQPVITLLRPPSNRPSEPCIPSIDPLDMPPKADVPAPGDGKPHLPLNLMCGLRFTYNGPDSMSGIIGLTRDLEAAGQGLDIFSEQIVSGGHRLSVRAVAEGRADIAAIDCLSWALAQRHEPGAKDLRVVGWTAKRKGLPFITARTTAAPVLAALRAAISV